MAAGCGMAQVASGLRKRGYSRRLGSARYLQIPAALPGAAGKRRQGPVSSDRTPVALRVAQDLRRNTAAPPPSLRGKTVRMQCCWMWASQRRLQPAHVLHVAELRIQGTKAHVSLRLSLTPCACAVNCGRACVGTCEHPDDVRPLLCRGRGLWQRHGEVSGQFKLHKCAI